MKYVLSFVFSFLISPEGESSMKPWPNPCKVRAEIVSFPQQTVEETCEAIANCPKVYSKLRNCKKKILENYNKKISKEAWKSKIIFKVKVLSFQGMKSKCKSIRKKGFAYTCNVVDKPCAGLKENMLLETSVDFLSTSSAARAATCSKLKVIKKGNKIEFYTYDKGHHNFIRDGRINKVK